ncbi:L,D-transpeptidase family protein [Stappia indica]|uniref:L,D-transpeptidase family protein n=1 Tax=Stappia indica TaxID=538381 RepID=UPI0008355BBA|nr:L,D-transpeptidase family protein [Stappia indica]
MARSIRFRPARIAATTLAGLMLTSALPALATTGAVPGAATQAETPAVLAAPLPEPALAVLLATGAGLSESDTALPFMSAERRKQLEEFYAARGHEPLWIADGVPTLEARRLVARLRQADRDGLKASDYALPGELARSAGRMDEARAARFEALLSAAALAYADQAQAGRVQPVSLSKNVTLDPEHPEPQEVLAALAASADPAATLEGYNPPQPGFAALREKLAEIRARGKDDTPPVVPEGPTLKEGMRDARVAVLRARLGLAVETAAEAPAEAEAAADGVADAVSAEDAVADATVADAAVADATVAGESAASEAAGGEVLAEELFDARVKEAVFAFQRENGLHADGVVGPRTLLALNAASDDGMAESDILANMERWRWMPRDLGAFHIFVNIPEFKARLFRDGTQVYETRVVVGKPSNQTPVFSDVMDHVIVNPYWNVPYSIASEELLPSIRSDASYLSQRNYEVLAGGRVVDPSSVDWSGVNLNKVRIRQRPGGGNALGQIKFMFPNRHAVYLHDTPSKSLFARSARAFSHGCVRVQDPFDFADALLQMDGEWTAARLKSMIGGQEKRADLTRPVPVHLAYFTAFVDENGNLQRRPDIYGHNATLTKALEIEGWEDWQRFAVAAPVKRSRPVAAQAEPAKKRKVVDLAAERQRMFMRRQRASSDY